ncbi:MAG: helix-turn-helix domain-containing protein [Hyphomicrobiaceae bacterium]
MSPIEAARIAGIGRTKLYEALGSGELSSLKIGKRRLILIDSLKEWLSQHSTDLGKNCVAQQSSPPLRGPRTASSPLGEGE